MEYRWATLDDAAALAAMNQQLIRDEGHRNRMSIGELEERMRRWLQTEYQAVVFESQRETLGYALFRHEPDWMYLRQFFVAPSHRRQGVGRKAIEWLLANVWRDSRRIRIDVLVGNSRALAFWRAVGFSEYCLMMERETQGGL